MNIHHLVPSVSRWLLSMGSLMLAAGHASGADLSKFKRIEPQFIAALGDPAATSGNGAQSWGFWNQDPGPRACKLDHYPQLKATGVAPAQWKFDASDWWLEEHGLIMEKPTFPLPAGKYLVTGDRDVTTVLTVHPKDKNGNQRWELADGATLYDVTHLGCRSARYTPAKAANACSPANAPTNGFPVNPGDGRQTVRGHGAKFGRKKDEAIAALLTHRSIDEAAKATGIAPKTLARWLQMAEFQAAYRKGRREAYSQCSARLQQASSAAVSTLLKVMVDPNTPAASLVRAAACVLDQASKAIELEDLEVRITELERAGEVSSPG